LGRCKTPEAELTIFDPPGNGAAHNISFTLNGNDNFLQGGNPVITTNFGLVKLRPIIVGANTQWYLCRGTAGTQGTEQQDQRSRFGTRCRRQNYWHRHG
jgi:hypothetical protein